MELGTSPLLGRAAALNKLKAAGYPVGILVAPVMLVEGWEALYQEMFKQLADTLSDEVKKTAFFEVIFMTYSYVHRAINQEAFPNAPDLFDPALMTGAGQGKIRVPDHGAGGSGQDDGFPPAAIFPGKSGVVCGLSFGK